MIEDRNLKPGTLLVAKYKGTEHMLEVKGENAYLNPATAEEFTSLSRAAMKITGNSVNGFRFWTLANQPKVDIKLDTVDLSDSARGNLAPEATEARTHTASRMTPAPGALVDDVAGIAQSTAEQDPGFENGGAFTKDAKRKPKVRTFNPIKPTPNQKGLEEGETRMWCVGCMASFKTDRAVDQFKLDDAICPAGHRVGDMREAANAATGNVEGE